jgi:hypothetical protein
MHSDVHIISMAVSTTVVPATADTSRSGSIGWRPFTETNH